MELYLDTADVAAVRRWSRILPLAGVTTNPSITAAGGMPLSELLPALREVLGPKGRLFAQVMGKTESEMVREALALRELDRDLVVKVPVCAEGLAAIKELMALGVPTLGTAVYTPMQGVLAALAGAEYVAPYVNRLDAHGGGWHQGRAGAATVAGAACTREQGTGRVVSHPAPGPRLPAGRLPVHHPAAGRGGAAAQCAGGGRGAPEVRSGLAEGIPRRRSVTRGAIKGRRAG